MWEESPLKVRLGGRAESGGMGTSFLYLDESVMWEAQLKLADGFASAGLWAGRQWLRGGGVKFSDFRVLFGESCPWVYCKLF